MNRSGRFAGRTVFPLRLDTSPVFPCPFRYLAESFLNTLISLTQNVPSCGRQTYSLAFMDATMLCEKSKWQMKTSQGQKIEHLLPTNNQVHIKLAVEAHAAQRKLTP